MHPPLLLRKLCYDNELRYRRSPSVALGLRASGTTPFGRYLAPPDGFRRGVSASLGTGVGGIENCTRVVRILVGRPEGRSRANTPAKRKNGASRYGRLQPIVKLAKIVTLEIVVELGNLLAILVTQVTPL